LGIGEYALFLFMCSELPKLTPEQEQVLEWMMDREDVACSTRSSFPGVLGGILAEDAGFGKTRLMCELMALRKDMFPCLIAVPRMVLSEWPPTVRAVTGVFPTLIVDGGFFVSNPTSFLADRKVVITTHGVLRNHYLKFGDVTWGRFVVDEAHVMRNKGTALYRACVHVASQSSIRWAVTATPVHNRDKDVLCLARFVGVHAQDVAILRDALVMHHHVVVPLVVEQPEKEDAVADVNSDIEVRLVTLDVISRAHYDKLKEDYSASSCTSKELDIVATACSSSMAFMRVLRLRQAATHPLIASSSQGLVFSSSSAKFDAVAGECRRLLETSRNVSASMPNDDSCSGVVVFCNWIMEMDLLEAFVGARFREDEVCVSRLDGACSIDERDSTLYRCRTDRETTRVHMLVCQIECANCGLNMQHAFNNVIMMRPQWNPVTEYQAIRRVLRRGQERTVRVLRLVAKDSVDEHVLERQAKKTRIIRDAMQDDVVATTLGSLSIGPS
jgi:superfamily II DNA or RNA helicase